MFKGSFLIGAWRNAVCTALFLFSTTSFAASSDILLSFELTHDMLATQDNFSVTLYEDGVALIHYPEYMTNAGDYVVELTPSEVQQLRMLVEHPLVQGFDRDEAQSQKLAIDAASQEFFEISDDSYSNFEFRTAGKSRSIRWANLSIDAQRYPDIGVFQKLHEIEAELLNLDQHPTATAVVD